MATGQWGQRKSGSARTIPANMPEPGTGSPPDRKGAIRRCAESVFAQKGFDRASIRDVAGAAEMSLAGLYYYYKSKEAILFDIQRKAFETLLDLHAEALAGVRDPEEKLRLVISGHVTYFADNLDEMKVLSRESETLTGEFTEPIGELKRRYVRLVKGIVTELGNDKDVRVSPNAALILFGMMNWMYTWYEPARSGSAQTIADHIFAIFTRGILGQT